MHFIESDDLMTHWAVAGTVHSGVLHGGNASDRLLELIDLYEIYSEAPSDWYRLESERTWLGETVNLCGTHTIEWSPRDRTSGCENLTRILQTIAASMLPFERAGCRHELGGCVTRLMMTANGPVCHHSLPVEVSHQFRTVGSQRQREHECFEQLECRLLLSGVPQVGGAVEQEAA